MGRTKMIFVSPRQVLRSIATAIVADVAAINRQIAKCDPNDRRMVAWPDRTISPRRDFLLRQRQAAFEPTQDLPRWAGRDLSPSERIRHQGAVRSLAGAGLVERNGRQIRLTPDGWTAAGVEPPTAEYSPDAAEPAARRWKSDAERMTAQRRAARDITPPRVADPVFPIPSLFSRNDP